MKNTVMSAILSLFIVFALPLALIRSTPLVSAQMEPEATVPAETKSEAPAPAAKPPVYTADAGETIRLLDGGEVREISLDKYLLGVVAAEMPAGFEPEALKAQTVAARTYTLWKLAAGPDADHPQADLCSDSECCQAYATPEKMAEKWGADAEQYSAKIAAAVAATDGKAILYNGQLIQALYHSSSGGYTEDAVAVWGTDVPYLRSVMSPEDGAVVPDYYSTQAVSAEEFQKTFQKAHPDADLSGSPDGWFKNLTRSSSGGVISVDVGGVTVRGTELRSLIGLRSTAFQPRVEGKDILFSVIGYGHGVGMSQYGANVLAKSGKTYDQILCWYYTGAIVSDYTAKNG